MHRDGAPLAAAPGLPPSARYRTLSGLSGQHAGLGQLADCTGRMRSIRRSY